MKKKKSTTNYLLAAVAALLVILILVLAALIFLIRGMEKPVLQNPGTEQTEHAATGETTVPTETTATSTTEGTTAPVPSETTGPTAPVEAAYVVFALPEAYLADMEHREIKEGGSVINIFSMKQESGMLELFRIFFGAPEMGKPLGDLLVEGKEVSVSISVSNYDASAFKDEAIRNRYYELMESLNLVLSTIQEDPRFRSRETVQVDTTEKNVQNWSFQLPQNVTWEQTQEAENMTVTFFGELNGIKVPLYAFAIGDKTLQTVLGGYELEGKVRPLSIESCALPATDGWEEKTVTELYELMDSINEVIQTLMVDEAFRPATE